MRRTVIEFCVQLVAALVQAAVLGLLVWALSKSRYPTLAEPDPAFVPRLLDYVTNSASVLLALGIGMFAGWRLSLVPPEVAPLALAQHRACDGPGRWLGPFFFALGVAAYVAYPLAARMVKPPTLQHFLWRSAANFRRLDPRPITRKVAYVVLAFAVFVHMGLRDQHVTVFRDGVSWRDVPWQADRSRSWDQLEGIEHVAAFVALTGRQVDRSTLRLSFRDGETVTFGRYIEWQPDELLRFLSILASASGKPVVRAQR